MSSEEADFEFERQLERERPRLLAFLSRTCGDGRDAEDVLQETLLRAHRARHQLQRPEQFRAWLYAIARHTCRRLHRRRAGAPEQLEPLTDLLANPTAPPEAWQLAYLGKPTDPELERIRQEAREQLDAALARVPEPFRKTLVLGEKR